MIKYSPKQLKKNGVPTGRWDYVADDGIGRPMPAGYCLEYFKRGNGGGHHRSAAEACKCFAGFVADSIKFDGMNMMRMPCAECRQDTFKCGMINGEAFVAICSDYCGNQFRKNLKDKINSAGVTVYPEICDDGL